MSIRILRKLLQSAEIRTVTVDVFDTVLLRKVYPEELQFYLHGKRASKILRERACLDVSPFTFVSLRQYLRKPIASERRHQGFDGEARLEEIFSLLLDFLLTAKRKSMTPNEKRSIVDALIAEELSLEKRLLRPHVRLVALLRKLKARGVRVYFLSDMYLSRAHVGELLGHFGIADVFDGGVTSSDLGYSKGSGRMSERILRGGVIGSFDPRAHVHIGDHAHADVMCAKTLASECIVLREFHHVCYRPLVRTFGRMLCTFMHWRSSRTLRRAFYRALREHTKTLGPDSRLFFRLGFEVFGPPLLHYLSYLHASSLFGKRPIYFLSGEAPVFAHLFRVLWEESECAPPVHALPAVNRINVLRSFAYLALTRTAVRDSRGILELFWWGQGKNTVRDFLESMGLSTTEWGFLRFLLERNDREEIVKMLTLLCENPSPERDRLLTSLERACHIVKNELSATDFLATPRLIVADVGWHGGIQVLLEEDCALLGWFPDVRGIYLGTVWSGPLGMSRQKNVEGVIFTSLQEKHAPPLFVPAIWEQILSRGREGMLSFLMDGIEACFSFWKSTSFISPGALFQETALVRQRFFANPSRDEVRLLGPLEHDLGSGLCTCRPLVNMRLPRRLIWRTFFREPGEFAHLYAAQYWQRGFLRWYGLHHFSRWKRCRTAVLREMKREQAIILRDLYERPVDYTPLNVPLAMLVR